MPMIPDADHEEFKKIEERLRDANRRLQGLVKPMALAKTVIELNSDQRKRALASRQRQYIERGEGAANSEALARSDPLYNESWNRLKQELQDAYEIAYEWDALKEIIGSIRSILARMRESINL